MYQITSQAQASIVEALLNELSYPQAVRAILAGNHGGWIWVDALDRPRIMLAWDGRDNVYLARRRETTSRSLGIALREDIQNTLEQEIFRKAALAGTWGYVLQAGPRHMTDPLVSELLRHHESQHDARLLFVMDIETSVPPVPEPIPGVQIRKVDAAFLAETDLAHHADLRRWIDENWPSPERYLEYGFGYAAVAHHPDATVAHHPDATVAHHPDATVAHHPDATVAQADGTPSAVLGWCMAEVVAGHDCGIGIETIDGHRRQGIGRLTAQAFLAEARRRLVRPWWDAWHSNLGSVRLAQALGLRQNTNYGVRFGWYNLLDNAVVHLGTALDRGDSRAAYGWLKRVLERSATGMAETARLWPNQRLEQRLLENPRLAAMLARNV